jgi:putative hydrolase of the HAD superfamily
MKKAIPITTLFLDIGGVLLTNGWDRHARREREYWIWSDQLAAQNRYKGELR